MLSPDIHILLNADLEEGGHNEVIDIHYSNSGGTNNINFSFVTRLSIPIPKVLDDSPIHLQEPELAFSADGSKFAMAMACGRVSVWDIRSKVPLKTFIVPKSDHDDRPIQYLQFSSGELGKETLVFVKASFMFTF